MLQSEWLALGIQQGWCGPPVCWAHDGIPMTWDEEAAIDEGGDPCVFVIRPYEDGGVKNAVEDNHAPSVWRRTNTYA